jgi:single-stranded DNA-binding protein
MNQVVISGKIYGDINHSYDESVSVTKFKIINQHYSDRRNTMLKTIVDCRCTGALADYVNSELYTGCNIIVTGFIQYISYVVNNTKIDRLVIYCSTVSRLEQEEYI